MKVKQLWRGSFNIKTSPRIEYAQAYTKKQAWLVLCRRIAKKDGVDPTAVMDLFDGTRDNYSIELEMEITEEARNNV